MTVGLAGCNGENTASPTSTSSIDSELRAPLTEFWAAFNDEDAQGFIDAYHPNSPYVPSREDINFGNRVSANNFTLVERSSDSAIVQVNATVSKESSETEQVVHTYELRPNNGEWDIFMFVVGTEIPDTDNSNDTTEVDDANNDNGGTEAPSASYAYNYDGSSTVTITHAGGNTIDPTNLYIRGDDGSGTTIDKSFVDLGVDSDRDVTAGMGVEIDVTNAAWDLRVVWVSDDGNTSKILSSSTGPDA